MAYRSYILFLFASVCLLLTGTPALAGEDWKPIDPAHMALKSPSVESDADAEVIFWEVRVNDAQQDLVFNHYIRIKVFTERGKESQSKIDIPYLGRNKVSDIAGRTIKPDGTIVELKKDAIFDRTIVKASGIKIKAKSFAMPAVEPGVIIEYRWREVRYGQLADDIRLELQRDIPVQSVKYLLKPFSGSIGYSSLGMSTQIFNGQPTPIKKEKDGFYSVSMSNIPAFREEPHMPPEDNARTWMLIYYTTDNKQTPQEYWPKIAKSTHEALKPYIKVNDEVKRATAEVIGDASTPEQKLERIYNYCQTKIKNINDDASGMTDSEREKVKANQSPSDTLKRGMGTGFDIRFLFAAMATAAGFESRIAMLSDRSEMFFDPTFTNAYFLDNLNVAVKVGDNWRFYDPASSYVPFGMLPWNSEGIQALVADPKQPTFVETPNSAAQKSMQKRTAKLRLTEDGTLEGDVRIEFTGQFAANLKEQYDDDSEQQREQNIRDAAKGRMSTSEITNIRLENITDPVKPFICSYRIRVPGYAQRTGKRLFLQPAFFQKGMPAIFTSGTRKYSIYFHYHWMEEDDVTIALPAGFVLDNADQPAPMRAPNVADYDVKIMVAGKSEELIYRRKFTFTAFLFTKENYLPLKGFFDKIHANDNHTITLKQAAAGQ